MSTDTSKPIPKYSGTAYDGGDLQLGNFPFIAVINLATAKVADGMQPLLKDHDPAKPLGQHRAIITATSMLMADGVISVPGQLSEEVTQSAKNGFPWQASVRGPFKKSTLLPAGESRVINGRTITGPRYIVDGFDWRETSATGLGANVGGPRLSIVASANQLIYPTITQRPSTKMTTTSVNQNEIYAAAIASRFCSPRDLELAGMSADALHEASSIRELSFHGLLEAALKSRNDSTRLTPSERAQRYLELCASSGMIEAAGFSGINLGSITDDVINRIVKVRFANIPGVVQAIAEQIDTQNFHELHRYDLISGGFLKGVAESGEIDGIVVQEAKSTNAPEDRAAVITVPRKYLINDDVGVLRALATILATRGRQTLERDFHSTVLNANWEVGKNKITGVFSAFSYAAMKSANQLWSDQESDGSPIAVGGAVLLTQSGSMEMDAKNLNTSEKVMARSDNAGSDRTEANVFHGQLANVIGTPWFRHKSMGAKASSTCWAQFSDPRVHSMFQVCYLGPEDGSGRVPRVDSTDLPFNQVGLGMRCLFSYGISRTSDVGAVFASGVDEAYGISRTSDVGAVFASGVDEA